MRRRSNWKQFCFHVLAGLTLLAVRECRVATMLVVDIRTSAVSRPSALSLRIFLSVLVLDRGKKGGEMLREGLAPWSRGACHVCVCL